MLEEVIYGYFVCHTIIFYEKLHQFFCDSVLIILQPEESGMTTSTRPPRFFHLFDQECTSMYIFFSFVTDKTQTKAERLWVNQQVNP